MTFPEIHDLFAALPEGGLITAESRLRRGLMYGIINKCRNKTIEVTYTQKKRTSPFWYTPFYPVYEATQQTDACFKKFAMPDYPLLDGIGSGLGYVGASGTVNTFIPVEGRVQWETFMNHPILKPRSKDIYILIESGFAYVYGTVRDFQMRIIPSDPRDIPTYNEEIDPYPVSAELIDMMIKMATNPDFNFLTKVPYDRVNDGRDATAINR